MREQVLNSKEAEETREERMDMFVTGWNQASVQIKRVISGHFSCQISEKMPSKSSI